MKLDELLKCEKVRCIKTKVDGLLEGEIYKVEGFNDEAIKIVDRNGYSSWHNKNLFETVSNNDMSKSDTKIDTNLNSVNGVPSTSTFKVGDKVYFGTFKEAKTVLKVGNDNNLELDIFGWVSSYLCCQATQENYEMLCKLYPHIEFEQPKPLTGSDLTKGMFERGDFAVVCKCSNMSELSAIVSSPLRLVIGYDNGRFLDNTEHLWEFAVPYDPRTRLPLTEDVLNETV